MTFSFLLTPRCLMVQPLIIWTAISLSIYASVLLPLMTRAMQNSEKVHPELAKD